MSWSPSEGRPPSLAAPRLLRAACPGRWPVAVLLVCLASGCVGIEEPSGFLVIERGRKELKAITADEAKLRVGYVSDRDQGGLDFWAKALRTEFVENRGYAPISEQEAGDDKGRRGHEFVLDATLEGIPHRYLCTATVLEGWWRDRIRLAEFVAPTEIFDTYLGDVRKAFRTIRP